MAFLALSCAGNNGSDCRYSDVQKVELVCSAHAPGSKSSIGAQEDAISSIQMFFYEDGWLLPELTVSGSAGGDDGFCVSLTLGIGRVLEAAVFANCQVGEPPATVQEARDLCYTCDGTLSWADGIPMSGFCSFTVKYSMPAVLVELTRLAAKVDLSIDTSGLEHGSVHFTSVTVKQMNRVCPFFRSAAASAENSTCDGDIASEADLAGINSSGAAYSASFYLLENLQGEILAGNTDPDSKIPSCVSEAGADPSLCTCLEITGVYSDRSGFLTGEPLTARLFLGSNATTNFDVRRNSHYVIVLKVTDKGCLRTDWKVESHLTDRRILYFDQTTLKLQPSVSTSIALNTNLSLLQGDFSYEISGDTDVFQVSAGQNGITVNSAADVPTGAVVTVKAVSWDGALCATCRISARTPSAYGIDCSWTGDLYVGQRGVITVTSPDGHSLDGRVVMASNGVLVEVHGEGATWYADGIYGGNNVVTVWIDGSEEAVISIDVLPPDLKFAADEIVLPLDGTEVECGPFYFRKDGTRLYYSDFAPDLYDRLLGYELSRTCISGMQGKYWPSSRRGNVAVTLRDAGTGGDEYYMSSLSALSYRSRYIHENYDFSLGRIRVEKVTATSSVSLSGISDAETVLCVEDPFPESGSLGTFDSWALTTWERSTSHNENIDITGLAASGYDTSCLFASAQETDSSCRLSFLSGGTLRVTVPYDDIGVYAMPKKTLTIIPGVRHSVTGEEYLSWRSFTATIRTNLAVGGIAEDNSSGGTDISVGWAFPRQDGGVLSSLENVIASANASVRGMYNTLYTVSGMGADEVVASKTPSFSFIPPGSSLSSQNLVSSYKYTVPTANSGGYYLVIWKYSSIYPASSGWVDR